MSIYLVAGIPYSDELYHHGIKGQRWGQRRFQNEDGSLTSEGYSHYGVRPGSVPIQRGSGQSNNISPQSNETQVSTGSDRKAKIKTGLKIGVAVAGTSLAVYGAYKLSQIHAQNSSGDYGAIGNLFGNKINFSDGIKKVSDTVNKTKSDVKNTAKKVSDTVNKTKSDVKNTAKKVSDTVNKAKSDVKNTAKKVGDFAKDTKNKTVDTYRTTVTNVGKNKIARNEKLRKSALERYDKRAGFNPFKIVSDKKAINKAFDIRQEKILSTTEKLKKSPGNVFGIGYSAAKKMKTNAMKVPVVQIAAATSKNGVKKLSNILDSAAAEKTTISAIRKK